jgi:hypothetical protein
VKGGLKISVDEVASQAYVGDAILVDAVARNLQNQAICSAQLKTVAASRPFRQIVSAQALGVGAGWGMFISGCDLRSSL